MSNPAMPSDGFEHASWSSLAESVLEAANTITAGLTHYYRCHGSTTADLDDEQWLGTMMADDIAGGLPQNDPLQGANAFWRSNLIHSRKILSVADHIRRDASHASEHLAGVAEKLLPYVPPEVPVLRYLHEYVWFVQQMEQGGPEDDDLYFSSLSDSTEQTQNQLSSEMLALAGEHGVKGLTPLLVAIKCGYLKDSSGGWVRLDDE